MKEILLPDRIFGKNTDEALERVLKGDAQQAPAQNQTQANAPDLNGFIYVPSINLYFAEERTNYNLNWKDTHKEIIPKGYNMPTPMETWELIECLKGNLGDSRFRKVYEDILKPQDAWHGEWQNAIFSKENKVMYVQKVTGIGIKGEPILSAKEKLEACLMQDGYADIKNKLNLNQQGLCKVASGLQDYTQGDNIYFWHPRENAVAGFSASSDSADLVCDRNPSNSYSSLGVRLVVRPKGASSKRGLNKQ